MKPNQKTNTISFTMQGQVPLFKDWLNVERDAQGRIILIPTEKVSMWEKQFAQKFRELYEKPFTGDAKLSVMIYTKKDSDSSRLARTILKVAEKYCITGRVRHIDIQQKPTDTLLSVRSEWTIITAS